MLLWAEENRDAAGNRTIPGASKKPSPPVQKCFNDGAEIPCHVGGAWWSVGHSCYAFKSDPQPPASSALWDGHRDGDGKLVGTVYTCLTPGIVGAAGSWANAFWLGSVPRVQVDPAVLARRAVKSMRLRAVAIGLTPPAGSGSYTLVGIPTWMWVAQPSATTWGPKSATAAADGVSVTATAQVASVTWDMGDGSEVECDAGTPYQVAYDAEPSPTCGHQYQRPGKYQVTATSHWLVNWEGAGQSGEITFDLRDASSVWVREAFALVESQ